MYLLWAAACNSVVALLFNYLQNARKRNKSSY